jgi:hypothetical protein
MSAIREELTMSTRNPEAKSENQKRQAEARRQARRSQAALADPDRSSPEEEADTSTDKSPG